MRKLSDLGNKEVFSNNLRKYIKESGKDKKTIAKILSIPYTTLLDWVNGKFYPRIDKIELLANFFDIQKSDLIENKSENFNYLDDLLFSKAKELSDDDKRFIINVMDARKKEIDDELNK